jgi:hypothetical protein
MIKALRPSHTNGEGRAANFTSELARRTLMTVAVSAGLMR